MLDKVGIFQKRSGNVETNLGCCIISSYYYLNSWRKEMEIRSFGDCKREHIHFKINIIFIF